MNLINSLTITTTPYLVNHVVKVMVYKFLTVCSILLGHSSDVWLLFFIESISSIFMPNVDCAQYGRYLSDFLTQFARSVDCGTVSVECQANGPKIIQKYF